MTANSRLLFVHGVFFPGDFTALTANREHWMVNNSIKLVRVDYMSDQPLASEPVIHYILLEVRTVLSEGSNLNGIETCEWELFCLSLDLVRSERSLARAMLCRTRKEGL